MIRKPAVAGSFYPASKEELNEMLDDLFKRAEAKEVSNGIIVPHAGYVYSGKTAAFGFKSMMEFLKKNRDVKNIVILGPSHRVYFEGMLGDENNEWETPLGKIKIRRINEIKDDKIAHSKEHSLEVQVPFVQYISEKLGRELAITPFIVGGLTSFEAKMYADILLKQRNCFFVVSSDLSHYLNLAYAKKTDEQTIKSILSLKYETLDACGKFPIMIAIEMAKAKGWKLKLLDYSTSADASGDKNAVVGYVAIGF